MRTHTADSDSAVRRTFGLRGGSRMARTAAFLLVPCLVASIGAASAQQLKGDSIELSRNGTLYIPGVVFIGPDTHTFLVNGTNVMTLDGDRTTFFGKSGVQTIGGSGQDMVELLSLQREEVLLRNGMEIGKSQLKLAPAGGELTIPFVAELTKDRHLFHVREHEAFSIDGNGATADTVTARTFRHSSDERLKTSIHRLEGALPRVLQLEGVRYTWRDSGRQDIGLIAQSVEGVFPEVVATNDTTGYKSIDYSKLVAPLIEALKEAKAETDRLAAELARRSQEHAELAERLGRLEAIVAGGGEPAGRGEAGAPGAGEPPKAAGGDISLSAVRRGGER